MNDSLHPILKDAHTYRIIGLYYDCSHEDFLQHTLDIHFKKDEVTRRLSFLAPQNLSIEKGFPIPTHGLEILNVRDRKLEHIRVSVRDFEASQGSISFDALDVVDIDEIEL